MLFDLPFRLDVQLTACESTEWFRDIIDDEHFTVIHELTVRKYVAFHPMR